MWEIYADMGVSFILSFLRISIKNPEAKETMRRAMKKVFDAIALSYPEFLDQ